MKKYLRRAFCAAVDWLVFQAPAGKYKERHEPEGVHCFRHIRRLFAGVYYCQVLDYEGYTLTAHLGPYTASLRVAVGPERECSFTGIHCYRWDLGPRLPGWLMRRYRYTRSRITRYLIPSLQYRLTKVGLARCPNCGQWGCDGDCVPF